MGPRTSPDEPERFGALPTEIPLPHNEGIFVLHVEEEGATWILWMSDGMGRIASAPLGASVTVGGLFDGADGEGAARLDALQRRLVAGEIPRGEAEVALRGGDGAARMVSVVVHAARDRESGRVSRLVGTARDITALRRAERELRAAEEQLRSVLDTVQVGVVVYDPRGRILLRNPMALEMFGLTEDHFSHLPGWKILREDGSEMPPEEYPVAQVLAAGAPVRDAVLGVRSPGGEVLWMIANAMPIRGDDGELRYVIISLADVTPRRRAEQALCESEERFRAAFHLSGAGMMIVTADGRMTEVNDALCEMVDRRREALVGIPTAEITHPEDVAVTRAKTDELLRGEARTCQVEKRYLRPSGQAVWALASATLVRDREGRPAYFIAQVQDISARKAAEEERARMEEQLRQAQKMEALGRLAGGVAHDFNNVLAAILANLERLEDASAAEPRALECAAEIRGAAQRGADLVRQILTFSRRSRVRRCPRRLGPVVREALRMVSASLPPSIALRASLPEDEAIAAALVDPTQILQMVVNLCTNACHAMERGGGALEVGLEEVEVDAALARAVPGLQEGAHVRLRVADTGEGMDEPTQQRMFEPFFTTKPAGKGTGLGLAVVHGIVQAHEGVIAVRSAPGQGTTVDVYLPALPGGRAERAGPAEGGRAPEAPPSSGPGPGR